MTSVGLVYFSGSGTTRVLANAAQQACETQGVQVYLVEVVGADIVEGRWQNEALAAPLDSCDAVLFGCPTYMGGVAAQLKAFFDAMAPRWYTQAWNGKLGAGFTVSAKTSGDKVNCLQDMHAFAMQMGMLWVGPGSGASVTLNEHGFYLGAGATAATPEQVTEQDLAAVQGLVARVIDLAKG